MKKVKVSLDKSKCINCGSCIAEAPNTFEQDGNFVTHLKGKAQKKDEIEIIELEVSDEDLKKINSAKDSCPTEAIKVEIVQ